ncbi:MAG: hypothetical protein M0C28_47975 [Candidatus Moduliflexus flocculans]|nr:hypothetical protein [Candidatus Moduliflexus flocculans]
MRHPSYLGSPSGSPSRPASIIGPGPRGGGPVPRIQHLGHGSSTARRTPWPASTSSCATRPPAGACVLKTKKDGTFKYVGLPHGIYQVAFRKEGFAEKTDEWKFEAPQDQMLKVEIPPVVMVSQEVLAEAEKMQQAAGRGPGRGRKGPRPATTTAPSPL